MEFAYSSEEQGAYACIRAPCFRNYLKYQYIYEVEMITNVGDTQGRYCGAWVDMIT